MCMHKRANLISNETETDGQKEEEAFKHVSHPTNASHCLLKFLFIQYGAIPHFTDLSTKEIQN